VLVPKLALIKTLILGMRIDANAAMTLLEKRPEKIFRL